MGRGTRTRGLALAALAALALAAVPSESSAESWCADPLWVHEWGVHTFASGGGERGGAGPRLPRYFHHRPTRPQAAGPPVRGLPVDSGVRALPVIHFYAGRAWRPVPLGLEVGFASGSATRWYPQVDARTPAAQANSSASEAARRRLLTSREARPQGQGGPPLGRDPTRQLHWDALVLTAQPRHRRARSRVGWVDRFRGFGSALWVNGAHESERFLFYEGDTRETPALRVERGPTHGPGRRHLVLRNVGSDDVHDVFYVHREAGRRYVFFAPRIPASRTAGFVVEDHAVAQADFAARTRDALRDRLVDGAQPAPPTETRWDPCVMMRDPAIPTEQGGGHRLYAHEVDAILDLWGPRFFERSGSTIVYREDVATLDREMPLSVYTDMYHHVQLRRLGLAVIEL